MRTLLVSIMALPLAACGVVDSAIDASRRTEPAQVRIAKGSSVTIPIPDRVEPALDPGGLDEAARFRSDFSRRDRFEDVSVANGSDVYVLDRASGCAYHVDARGGRSPVLAEGGRPDCTYRDTPITRP